MNYDLYFSKFKNYRHLVFTIVLGAIYSNSIAQQKINTKAQMFVTAESTNQLLSDYGMVEFEPLEQPDEDYPTIFVDDDITFQTIHGFGGAFTDAAAITFAKLPTEVQNQFLTECFDPIEGHGYNLCRTTIHSCDYSDSMYTYAEVEGDIDLEHFTIKHDMKYRIPMIKSAMEASKGNLRFFASPWSPPAWMKTNNEMKHGGKLKLEYQQTWANYFVKYVQEYKKLGIPMWGITVQNEALANQIWESCIYTAKEEKDFVRDYLGPTLHKNEMADIKLMIWDHNRGIIQQRAEVAFEDTAASKYIWGTAFHWYVGDHFDNIRILHDAYPDKDMIYSEAGTRGTWEAANKMAKNIIMDLNNWASGWVFWNLMLDQNNGPRHAGDVFSSNIVNANINTGEITYNPPHYVFGHFSKFIKPGAKRLPCTSSSDEFIATAFVNTNGKIAVVIYNLSDTEQKGQMWIEGKVVKFSSPANGLITMVF
ncbi:MAG: glycoside hydrolase family 30 protein [Salinivirgaceae bacterium]|jgi:glucosylceramidase|nr:glycoside hydrolase family 30 protein [Salinivirgaceae bacterium]